MTRYPTAWIAASAACVLLAGCQGQPAATRPSSSWTGATQVATQPTPGGSVATPTTHPGAVSVASAKHPRPGVDFQVIETLGPRAKDGSRQGLDAMSSTGTTLVSREPIPAKGSLIAQAVVTLRRKGQVSVLSSHAMDGPQPRQAVEAAIDPGGNTAAWLETESTDLYDQDWVVFANHEGKLSKLGTSRTFLGAGQLPMPAGSGHAMATDGQSVWWEYTLPLKGEGPIVTNIAVAPAGGGAEPRRAVEHAKFPVADGGGLLYVRDVTVDRRMGSRFEIRSLGGAGRDVLVRGGDLGSGLGIGGMCASPRVLAWTIASREDNPGGLLFVQDRRSGRTASYQLRDNSQSMDMGCGDDFVTWSNGSGTGDAGQYLAKLDDKFFVLGNLPGISGVYAAGRYSAWTLPPKGPTEPASTRIVRWR